MKKKIQLLFALVIIACSGFLFVACSKNEDSTYNGNNTFTQARVTHVTDGDTISVDVDGKEYKIRMVGVDTPETVHPNKPVEYYGKEASNFTKKSLTGKTVYLQKDVSDTDRYGRLLRYIWIKRPSSDNPTENEIREMMYNAILVKEGYAYVYIYQPDIRYNDFFRTLQTHARENKIGLWADPSQTKEDKSKSTLANKTKQVQSKKSTSVEVNSDTDVSQNTGKIKGNKKTKVYHLPGGKSYDTIKEKNVIYFNNEKEAQEAGYRKAGN